MTKVIKEKFEKLESLKIDDDSFACNTSPVIFHEEFNRMSRMDDDLFTYKDEISGLANIPSSKFYNHKTMDHYTKNALWIYWARGDDEVELTDEESLDSDDEDQVAEFFRINTSVFDFETPMCRAFKEFNYLLLIDPYVLTKNIERFKTYKDYKDDWISEWNEDVSWWPTYRWKDNGYCNGGNFLEAYIVGNTLLPRFIMDNFEDTNRDQEERQYEMEHEDKERCELFDDQERPVYNIRRFDMIKYSFGDDEEYVTVKENEYDDLTSTSKEAIYAYQEIFRMMDEGWMVSPYGVLQFMDTAYWSPVQTSLEKKLTKLVKYQSSGILCVL
ncbi:hypothetical protein Tco_0798591 [Tanacetum coccineum]